MAINRLFAVLVCTGLGMFPLLAGAKGLNYSYGEIGYSKINSDPVDAQGATVKLSYAALDFIHVKFDYSRLWVDTVQGTGDDDIDIDRFVFGAGGNYSLFDNFDILGTASWISNENSGDNNNSDRGYQGEFGIRALVMKPLELNARVIHVDTDAMDDTGFGAGVVYKFYKKFAFSVDARYFNDDEVTDVFAGVRLNF